MGKEKSLSEFVALHVPVASKIGIHTLAHMCVCVLVCVCFVPPAVAERACSRQRWHVLAHQHSSTVCEEQVGCANHSCCDWVKVFWLPHPHFPLPFCLLLAVA